jgi:hypothetical protein
VSKAIQKAAVKSPSDDFTQNLMHKINAAQASQTTIVYQPLISQRVWGLLGAIFTLLIGYVAVQNIGLASVSDFIQEASGTMSTWTVSTWEVLSIDLSIANKSPYVYGALILFGFLLLEIAILKRKYS